jgi:hypothetical protein
MKAVQTAPALHGASKSMTFGSPLGPRCLSGPSPIPPAAGLDDSRLVGRRPPATDSQPGFYGAVVDSVNVTVPL